MKKVIIFLIFGFLICFLLLAINFQDYTVDGQTVSMWNQTYGGEMSDTSRALIQTPDGGYIIAGFTASFGQGENDFWLIKTDENGIIPEFPSWIILPLFLTVTLVAILMKKRMLNQRS